MAPDDYIHRPQCRECKQRWRWPRNLAYVQYVDPSKQKPTTKSTVVAHLNVMPETDPPVAVIPENVFRDLELTKPTFPFGRRNRPFNRVVDQFTYHPETGKVFIREEAKKEDECDLEFAQLVTLTWWYQKLFFCLRDVSLQVMDYYSNALLCFVILFASESVFDEFTYSKTAFVIAWFSMTATCILFSIRDSIIEWGVLVSPHVGDLAPMNSWLEEFHAFLALVMFNWFMVTNDIKNCVILLHPWKSVQPYAAVKVNGVRAHVVGYLNKSMYIVRNRTGTFYTMFLVQILKTGVFVFKAYVAIWLIIEYLGSTGDGRNKHDALQFGFLVITSLPSIFIGWYTYVEVAIHRRKIHPILMDIRDQGIKRHLCDECRDKGQKDEMCSNSDCGKPACPDKSCTRCTELQRRRCDGAVRLLQQDFDSPWRLSDARESGSYTDRSKKHDECTRCGRNTGNKFRGSDKSDKSDKSDDPLTPLSERSGETNSHNNIQSDANQPSWIYDPSEGLETPKVGATVKCVDWIHDARFGCLKKDEIGKVLKVIESPAAGDDARCLVERRIDDYDTYTEGQHKYANLWLTFNWTENGLEWAKAEKIFKLNGRESLLLGLLDETTILTNHERVEMTKQTGKGISIKVAMERKLLYASIKYWYDKSALRVVDACIIAEDDPQSRVTDIAQSFAGKSVDFRNEESQHALSDSKQPTVCCIPGEIPETP